MRQVVQAVNLRYKGQPTITVTVDGVPILSDQTLPSHNVMKNRRITLPPGGVDTTLSYKAPFKVLYHISLRQYQMCSFQINSFIIFMRLLSQER